MHLNLSTHSSLQTKRNQFSPESFANSNVACIRSRKRWSKNRLSLHLQYIRIKYSSVSSVTGNCAHPKIRTVCVTDAARRPIFVSAPYDLFTKAALQRNVSALTFVYVLYDLCPVLIWGSGLRKTLAG